MESVSPIRDSQHARACEHICEHENGPGPFTTNSLTSVLGLNAPVDLNFIKSRDLKYMISVNMSIIVAHVQNTKYNIMLAKELSCMMSSGLASALKWLSILHIAYATSRFTATEAYLWLLGSLGVDRFDQYVYTLSFCLNNRAIGSLS